MDNIFCLPSLIEYCDILNCWKHQCSIELAYKSVGLQFFLNICLKDMIQPWSVSSLHSSKYAFVGLCTHIFAQFLLKNNLLCLFCYLSFLSWKSHLVLSRRRIMSNRNCLNILVSITIQSVCRLGSAWKYCFCFIKFNKLLRPNAFWKNINSDFLKCRWQETDDHGQIASERLKLIESDWKRLYICMEPVYTNVKWTEKMELKICILL